MANCLDNIFKTHHHGGFNGKSYKISETYFIQKTTMKPGKE